MMLASQYKVYFCLDLGAMQLNRILRLSYRYLHTLYFFYVIINKLAAHILKILIR